MDRFDVAVVGGGPGGMSAGWAAARGGADAVVIEKGVPRADRDELGPDSTDAAGMLDYWVDLMALPDGIPEHVILRDLEGAKFHGPSESATLRSTSIPSEYPNFGFTFHRARFDDWLREEAEGAGTEYRVGVGVREVTHEKAPTSASGYRHTLTLRDGTEISSEYLILADGPQRTITMGILEDFTDAPVADPLGARRANHIAYQEHRKFPEELFEPDFLEFWWGIIPGHTAYPWIFPNDGTIGRVGLTMPIDVDLDEVPERDSYRLLRPEDDRVPLGKEYVRRLLEAQFPEYDVDRDFPLVEGRGKRGGVESYPISSTRPIDSPTRAGIAVVGGAMGVTSAFHEGGDHVAVRSGKIAGSLASAGVLEAYNREWKRAIGTEVVRNVAFADVVRDFTPTDWDRSVGAVRRMVDRGGTGPREALGAGIEGTKLLGRYRKRKFDYRGGRYVQLAESEFSV
ncbi:NAD(P)/FAD-dependent oxidoreductase [Halobacteriales archaeon QS_3_64_16]|nr:MAG: NAD(P)/FAD-dependent oxidoreductase [Halobacteriales archaeon QS_3_64_16]